MQEHVEAIAYLGSVIPQTTNPINKAGDCILTYGLLISAAVKALARPAVFKRVHEPLRHLIVDEYQDINPAQEKLISLLAKPPVCLCVVADDDQAIYQWRGSDVSNMQEFTKRYKPVTSLSLSSNRRSRPTIIATANVFAESIEPRLPKKMVPHREADGPEVHCWAAETIPDEAKVIADSVWRATEAVVWVAGQKHKLIVAINEATAEVKYFLTNATTEPLARVLAVAFRRWTVEHSFRLGKQEAGLMHFEGRDYLGLIRHLVLALVVLGFVATHTQRLRGEKSPDHRRTGMPGPESALRDDLPSPPGHTGTAPHQRGPLLPPTAKPASNELSQKAAA